MFTNAKIIGDGVSYEEYAKTDKRRGDPALPMSRGLLCEFLECPSKWRKSSGDDEQTDSMAWGSMLDCLILTPEQFPNRYRVCPSTYPDSKTGEQKPWNWNANYCKQFRDDVAPAECIKHDDADALIVAKSALMANDEIAAYLACSQRQVMVTADWQDEATGIMIPVRILIDALPDDSIDDFRKTIGDLKSTISAQPDKWKRHLFDYDLYVQAALYIDVVNAITGEDRCDFRHIIQESRAPYETATRIVSQDFIDMGRTKYRTALTLYAQCLATNTWPSYDANAREKIGNWAIVSPDAWMIGKQSDWPVDRITN